MSGVASAVAIGGTSREHKRHAADFYPTPPECTEALMRAFPVFWVGKTLWEPACGDGAISRVLERENVVVSTDLHGRGYGTGGTDFLAASLPRGIDGIVTNPPFDIAEAFITRACSFGVPVAMLLKSSYWHAKSRVNLLRQTGPFAICALTWRPKFCPDRGAAPTMDFIWTVWAGQPQTHTYFTLLERP